MFLSVFICSIFLLSVGAQQDPCAAEVSASPRAGGNWEANGVPHQIYDISVTNTGRCPITSLFSFFGFPAEGDITGAWNYDKTSGEISSFGGSLASGASFNGAGFILSGNVTPTLAFTQPKCPSECQFPGGTTGSSSTTGSVDECGGACAENQVCVSLGPEGPKCHFRSCQDLACEENQVCINDGGVARCITVTPTCSVSVEVEMRPNSGFLDENGQPNQIWDLSFTNTGSGKVTALIVEIIPAEGTSVVQGNIWNLVRFSSHLTPSNLYTVLEWGALASSGSQFLGAGFVVAGETTEAPTVTVNNVLCQ